ncbi:hypothetical protein [Halodesulfovibrio spirochaetisodalis]|uniref:Uncharacterized protein n=1 Tax=Halodesulfovibrio spirochaetisodalis TaxID=1560234 RepID=A0A1B7XD25_9BACT|nr:hypothetical protein [Halodesulfovibrio spirochaetisodalis]OBQ51899.1 hypothetical protein SP90_08690 [Halodesulfovibrio spirochaetisodalis]
MKISNLDSKYHTNRDTLKACSKQQLDDATIKTKKLNADIEQHSPHKATSDKELSLKEIGDVIALSKESLARSQEASKLSQNESSSVQQEEFIPVIKSNINHTTLAGNKFTFKDTKQGLLVDVTTKDGESYQVKIGSELIISEDKDGNLRFNDECTDGNDIVVSFSKDVTTGSGDDFVLLIEDSTRNQLRSKVHIDRQKTTIDTGPGNDTIHVVSNLDKIIDIKSGYGSDNITVKSSEKFGDAQGVEVHLDSGSGDDTVHASNLYGSSIITGDGNDKITVDNSYGLGIMTGDGDDELSLSTVNRVSAWMGKGDDILDAQHIGVTTQRFQQMKHRNGFTSHGGTETLERSTTNYIYTGSGDDTITLDQVNKMEVCTGSGKNKITLNGAVKNTYFLCAGGDVTFTFNGDISSKLNNVMFLQLSDESSRKLHEALKHSSKDTSIKVFTGSLGKYSSNIGVNISGGKEKLKQEVRYQEALYRELMDFNLDEYA